MSSDDDVLAAALREAGLQRLAEAEVPRVVEDADAVELGGELGRDRAPVWSRLPSLTMMISKRKRRFSVFRYSSSSTT